MIKSSVMVRANSEETYIINGFVYSIGRKRNMNVLDTK